MDESRNQSEKFVKADPAEVERRMDALLLEAFQNWERETAAARAECYLGAANLES